MRSIILLSFLLSGGFVILNGQQNIYVDSPEYQEMKSSGNISPNSYSVQYKDPVTPVVKYQERSGGACDCLLDIDTSFTLAMAPCDDGSTALIPIPFNFCLYGSSFNALWINNNGNITFDNAYATFSAVGFPSSSYVMVAPFWADVDTRDTGAVYYKITPTAVIVKWEAVGYFNSHDSLVNTFQLIITDGTDPLVPGGNVSFCYGDMQWTTGDASMGIGGFGGTPATVGINSGDGINYIQVGQFSVDDTIFDGSYGSDDGVHFLDDKWVVMNSCVTNIPPIGLGDACDTVVLMVGTTIDERLYFLAPEITQITSLILPTNPGFSMVNTNTGSTTILDYQFTGTLANVGYNTLTFTAVDDGTIPDTSTLTKVYHVISTAGIDENSDDQITIYPNPSTGIYFIDWKNLKTETTISVSNLYGQSVCHVNNVIPSGAPYHLDMRSLADGIYFVSIGSGEKQVTKKLFLER